MPGDPYINEAGCIFMLQQAINQETQPYHQNAALQVVMDLYDRKVTREEFARNAGTAIAFYATLAKLYVVEQTRTMLAAETLNMEAVGKSSIMLTEIATEKAAALTKIMTLLSACATTRDAVH